MWDSIKSISFGEMVQIILQIMILAKLADMDGRLGNGDDSDSDG